MRRRGSVAGLRGASAAGALAALLAGAAAHAQRDADAIARESYGRGLAALEAGDNRAAVDAFEFSYRLNPRPAAQYNLGLSYLRLGSNADAVTAFERYLAAPEDGADPERLAAVRAEVARMRPLIATLALRVDPAGARILVDGRERDAAESLLLDPGRHVIEAEAPGFHTRRAQVTLAAGASDTMVLSLDHAAGAPAPALAAPAQEHEHETTETILLGGGVALTAVGLGVAGAFALAADALRRDYTARCVGYTAPTTASECDALRAERQGQLGAYEVSTYVALGAGVVGLGLAAAALAMARGHHAERATAGVAVIVGPGSVGAEVHF